MLDVSATHPFEACAAFAVRWLGRIAASDLAGAEALIDVNESDAPFAQSFPPPEGFTYCHPTRAANWTMHIVAADQRGLSLDFEVPFVERGYRPMLARFDLRRVGNQLEVRFLGLVPS
jgi:hypothetical protein